MASQLHTLDWLKKMFSQSPSWFFTNSATLLQNPKVSAFSAVQKFTLSPRHYYQLQEIKYDDLVSYICTWQSLVKILGFV
jgi:hypothetical protein